MMLPTSLLLLPLASLALAQDATAPAPTEAATIDKRWNLFCPFGIDPLGFCDDGSGAAASSSSASVASISSASVASVSRASVYSVSTASVASVSSKSVAAASSASVAAAQSAAAQSSASIAAQSSASAASIASVASKSIAAASSASVLAVQSAASLASVQSIAAASSASVLAVQSSASMAAAQSAASVAAIASQSSASVLSVASVASASKASVSAQSIASIASASLASLSSASIASISSASIASAASKTSASALASSTKASSTIPPSTTSLSSGAAYTASVVAAYSPQATALPNTLGLQHYNLGYANLFAAPVFQGGLFGAYYSGAVPFYNLNDALTWSCQQQRTLCDTYGLANFLFFNGGVLCDYQQSSCLKQAALDVTSNAGQPVSSTVAISSSAAPKISSVAQSASSSVVPQVSSTSAPLSSVAAQVSSVVQGAQSSLAGQVSSVIAPASSAASSAASKASSIGVAPISSLAAQASSLVAAQLSSAIALIPTGLPVSQASSIGAQASSLAAAQISSAVALIPTGIPVLSASAQASSIAAQASSAVAAQISSALALVPTALPLPLPLPSATAQASSIAAQASSLLASQISSALAQLPTGLPLAQASSIGAQASSLAAAQISSAVALIPTALPVASAGAQASSIASQASSIVAAQISSALALIPTGLPLPLPSATVQASSTGLAASLSSIASQASSYASSLISPSIVPSTASSATSAISSTPALLFGKLPSGYSSVPVLISEGSTGRALAGTSTSSSSMTPAVCASYCSSAGFPISATEYSSECYCGSSLVNGASLSTLSPNAPMTCSGDSTLTCGGSSALQLVYDSSKLSSSLTPIAGGVSGAAPSAVPSATSGSKIVTGSLPAGFNSIPVLIAEGSSGRALNGPSTSSSSMTPSTCASYCSAAGFPISATEYSSECYCGSGLTNGASLSTLSPNTPMPCSGDATLTCGAGNALQIIYDSSKVSSSLTPIAGTASTVASSAQASAVINHVGSLPSGYSSIPGLVAEGSSGRALNGPHTSSSTMTPSICASYCSAAGFPISGTEYSSECYCGAAGGLSNGASISTLSPNSGMPCSGDATLTCGGSNALTIVYNSALVSSSLQSIGNAASSVASSAQASASAAVVNVGSLPGGLKSASSSLIAEGTSGRALISAHTSSPTMTPAVCAAYCSNLGYGISGSEYGSECWCGNELSNGASLSIPSPNAGMPCSGDSTLTCGGPNALTIIYDSSLFNADLTPKPAAVGSWAAVSLPNGFSSDLSCIAEIDGRLMKGAAFSSSSMSYSLCTDFCKKAGFSQAGLEYGSECYCSSSVDFTKVLPSTQCNSPCSGDPSKICGGGQALQIFTTSASTATKKALSNGWNPTQLCLAEPSGARLFARDNYSDNAMTQESCTSFCASKGWDLAGMEYASQCFCASSADVNIQTSPKSSACSMACAGDQTELCGGPNALTVFTAPSSSQPSKRQFPKRV